MEYQTKNRIGEEWIEKWRWDMSYQQESDLPKMIADWWLSKIDELLKSQRDSLVDRLPECAWCDLENGRGKYLLESDIINLIKNN